MILDELKFENVQVRGQAEATQEVAHGGRRKPTEQVVGSKAHSMMLASGEDSRSHSMSLACLNSSLRRTNADFSAQLQGLMELLLLLRVSRANRQEEVGVQGCGALFCIFQLLAISRQNLLSPQVLSCPSQPRPPPAWASLVPRVAAHSVFE